MNAVALITGGSRGIGRGIALALAREGFHLLLNYRSDQPSAEEARALCLAAAAESGKQIEVELAQADISDLSTHSFLLEQLKRRFGRIDLLVNNAGVAPEKREDLLQASEASFDRLIDINLKGPFFLTQTIARWMIELVEAKQIEQPAIVTISSISAYTASIQRGDYCLSKAALSMMTTLFAARLSAHGIGVYEIRPGIIATDMTAAVKEKYDKLISEGLLPVARWGTPDDVGRAVLVIARRLLPYSTGEVINVDGGFHLRRL